MNGAVFIYIGALTVILWGIAHLFPTRNVVRGFGPISKDNQRIITMEWITEGVAMIFVGTLLTVVTWIDPASPVSLAVYWTTAMALVTLAVVSFFTGFKVSFFPFKLCPFIFSASAILTLAGAYLA